MWKLQRDQDVQTQAGSWMQAGAADHLQACGNQTCYERSDRGGKVLELNRMKKVAEWGWEICCILQG